MNWYVSLARAIFTALLAVALLPLVVGWAACAAVGKAWHKLEKDGAL